MDVFTDYLKDLNWVAVVVSALAAFVVGFVWYSKPVFGTIWMKGAGLKEKDMKGDAMMKPMVAGVISVLVTATAFGTLFDVLALEGAVDGALLGVMLGVGFLGANKLMSNAYEQKNTTFSSVVILGDIASLAAMGVVYSLIN